MKIYLSSFTIEALTEYCKIFPDEKLNILLSFAFRSNKYLEFMTTYKDKISSLILDSGAFTLNSSTNKKLLDGITFEAYKGYLNLFSDNFDYYFNYDANFDKDGLFDNLYYQVNLQNKGHKPVPVVHNYQDSELELYLNEPHWSHDIIALGYAEDKWEGDNIERLALRIHEAKKKVHVLGVASYRKLVNTPIQYSDSSSWVQYGKYGQIRFWNVNKDPGKIKNINDPDMTDTINFKDGYTKVKAKEKFSDDYYYTTYYGKKYLEEYLGNVFGWEWHELLPPKNIKRMLVNIHYFVQLQKRITERHIAQKFLV